MTRKLFLLSIVVLSYLVARSWESRPVSQPPGVLVSHPPLQTSTPNGPFQFGTYQLDPRARFEVSARVLSTRNYRTGRESDLSPLDLALGWGPMSDTSILERIEISQGGRWYRTRYDWPPPLDEAQIITSSGNMHMIPASRQIEERLKALRVGEIVMISGLLVDVSDSSGWSWRTSLSRNDSGSGACEIVFVESLLLEP